ncbi:hypothetical protein BGZ72_010251 [Mortierella alpina]|nr:hypothetical protein BGZ72_010251 [Mortierella alpina]
MNPKRKAAAALTPAPGSAPVSASAPVPASAPALDIVSAPAPDPATPTLETPAAETQATATQQPQTPTIRQDAPPGSDKKDDTLEQFGVTTEQGHSQDTSEHVDPSGMNTAAAHSPSPVPAPSVEITGSTSTEPATTFTESSEVTVDSSAEPDTTDLSDTSNPTKKRVGPEGPEQDKTGIRGGGAKRRLTNPKPGRRRAG